MLETDAESTKDGLFIAAAGLILCKGISVCGAFLEKECKEYTRCPKHLDPYTFFPYTKFYIFLFISGSRRRSRLTIED